MSLKWRRLIRDPRRMCRMLANKATWRERLMTLLLNGINKWPVLLRQQAHLANTRSFWFIVIINLGLVFRQSIRFTPRLPLTPHLLIVLQCNPSLLWRRLEQVNDSFRLQIHTKSGMAQHSPAWHRSRAIREFVLEGFYWKVSIGWFLLEGFFWRASIQKCLLDFLFESF